MADGEEAVGAAEVEEKVAAFNGPTADELKDSVASLLSQTTVPDLRDLADMADLRTPQHQQQQQQQLVEQQQPVEQQQLVVVEQQTHQDEETVEQVVVVVQHDDQQQVKTVEPVNDTGRFRFQSISLNWHRILKSSRSLERKEVSRL